jgi:hypothetical protein
MAYSGSALLAIAKMNTAVAVIAAHRPARTVTRVNRPRGASRLMYGPRRGMIVWTGTPLTQLVAAINHTGRGLYQTYSPR